MAQTLYAVQFEYLSEVDSQILRHSHRIWVKLDSTQGAVSPGAPLDSIQLETNGLTPGSPGTTDALTGVSEYLSELLSYAGTHVSFTSGALVKYVDGVNSATQYIAPIDFTDTVSFPSLQGAGTAVPTSAQQETMTFFDSRGKVSKLVFIEMRANRVARFNFSEIGLERQAFVSYIVGGSSIVRGAPSGTADTDKPSRLTAFKLLLATQNEAVYRKRHRG